MALRYFCRYPRKIHRRCQVQQRRRPNRPIFHLSIPENRRRRRLQVRLGRRIRGVPGLGVRRAKRHHRRQGDRDEARIGHRHFRHAVAEERVHERQVTHAQEHFYGGKWIGVWWWTWEFHTEDFVRFERPPRVGLFVRMSDGIRQKLRGQFEATYFFFTFILFQIEATLRADLKRVKWCGANSQLVHQKLSNMVSAPLCAVHINWPGTNMPQFPIEFHYFSV